ncbi:MAG: hypothetical protein ACP59X_19025 [Solidesulfovibrio sp. DCME]|jgi:hypothetical protein|uniref:hypothetical protein n=1 Tax=Solidesulfovibrio sp. DCME TaxID=3447380 RepID=UPI003D10B5FC
MSTADKLLARMRQNPRDWRIEDVDVLARRFNLRRRRGGTSHVIYSFPGVLGEATVPDHKPIKSIYIKAFVRLIDDVLALEE